MTRTQLVEALARKHGLDEGGVRTAVNAVLEALSLALACGHRVELRRFGSFGLNQRRPRLARNPKTGLSVPVPAKRVPHFKVGKDLRERVNAVAYEPG
jgi:integration host factor subunit beta